MDSPANARVAALALLAKATNALGDDDAEGKRNSSTDAELVAELEARLLHLFPDIGAVDVNAPCIEAEDILSESQTPTALDGHNEV